MSAPIRQPDLFGTPQGDLFSAHDPAPQSPDRMQALVRPRLAALLAEVRGADRLPWDAQKAAVNAILFHNMANWLPANERDAQRAAFRSELERLGAE